jgi:hypothetical protein
MPRRKQILVLAAMLMAALSTVFTSGCSSRFVPAMELNKTGLTKQQQAKLKSRKMHVPCRVEVKCANVVKCIDDGIFSDEIYTYPLRSILESSFRNGTHTLFEPAGAEIIDAFTLYITVHESSLELDDDDTNYTLQLIARFDEPGEKKIKALAVRKHVQVPFKGGNNIPDAVYKACREAAYDVLERLSRDPKVRKTVARFEDR